MPYCLFLATKELLTLMWKHCEGFLIGIAFNAFANKQVLDAKCSAIYLDPPLLQGKCLPFHSTCTKESVSLFILEK